MPPVSADASILAIETSGSIASVALGHGENVLAERMLDAGVRHASVLLPALGSICRDAGVALAEIRLVCFSAGPGSFTGLRVAATVASMIQSVSGCDVVAVHSLQAIAANCLTSVEPGGLIVPLLPASHGHVFAAAYARENDELIEKMPEQMCAVAGLATTASAFAAKNVAGSLLAVGEGIRGNEGPLLAAGFRLAHPSLWNARAARVLRLGARLAAMGRFCGPGEIVPHYIRPPEAEQVYESRRAAARLRRGE